MSTTWPKISKPSVAIRLGIRPKSQDAPRLISEMFTAKILKHKNNYRRGTNQRLDSHTADSYCCAAKYIMNAHKHSNIYTHTHKNNTRTHALTHTDATLSAYRLRIDVYRANVFNLEQSNMISETGGEHKCMWRNVWFMSFEIFLKETDVCVASLNTLLYAGVPMRSPAGLFKQIMCTERHWHHYDTISLRGNCIHSSLHCSSSDRLTVVALLLPSWTVKFARGLPSIFLVIFLSSFASSYLF